MRAVFASGVGQATTPHNAVRYRSCKRILFVKKCSWKTKYVPRGFNNGEISLIYNNLQHFAHNYAINAIPNNLGAEIEGDKIDVKIGRKIARKLSLRMLLMLWRF